MRFISIDSSTNKTGVAYFLDGKLAEYLLLDKSDLKSNPENRFAEMANAIVNVLHRIKPHVVWIEDTWNAQNIQTTKTLSEMIGIVHGYCLANNIEFHKILPSEWRKYCGISQGKKSRKELKEASIEYVRLKYNVTVGDDVADAIALGDGVLNYYNTNELFE